MVLKLGLGMLVFLVEVDLLNLIWFDLYPLRVVLGSENSCQGRMIFYCIGVTFSMAFILGGKSIFCMFYGKQICNKR